MNLIDFYNKISSDQDNVLSKTNYFSEEVTMFNILNGMFLDKDILDIKISRSIVRPIFSVTISTEEIAKNAELNIDKQIVPGAFKPLYEININRNSNVLDFILVEV